MNTLYNITSTNIGIFYKDQKWKDDLFEELLREAHECKTLYSYSVTENRIRFCDTYININIIFVGANEHSRGHRFDRIYYQNDIDQNTFSMVIRPLFMPKIFPLYF